MNRLARKLLHEWRKLHFDDDVSKDEAVKN